MERLKVIVILSFAFVANTATSQETFGGIVSEDMILDLSNSPYIVNCTVYIERNATLTIEPGVHLNFDPGVGIVVNGSLLAIGSDVQRITFTAAVPSSTSGTPISWSGISWVQGAGSVTEHTDFIPITRSTSALRYVNVTSAGFLFIDDGRGVLQSAGNGPALQAVGLAPVLDNVYVGDNYGSGIEWRDITNLAELVNSSISNNVGDGLSFTSDGIGRLLLDGCTVNDNNANGISVDFFKPANTFDYLRYKFCSFSMDIDENIYLDHETADFQDDPNQCVQVLSSPPGTTMTAYIISTYGTEIRFWNGNSTNDTDIISVRRQYETYGTMISSTTNAMTVRVSRPYAWYSSLFSMLITVQEGPDKDFAISNSEIKGNGANGIYTLNLYRTMLIIDSFLCYNVRNGIYIGENYGREEITNVVVERNGQHGFQSAHDHGTIMIKESVFNRNGNSGTYVTVSNDPWYHNFNMLMDKSSTSYNGVNGVLINHVPLRRCYPWRFSLTGGETSGNMYNGLELAENRYCSNIDLSRISGYTIAENKNTAIDMSYIHAIEIDNNLFMDNAGADTILFRLPDGSYDDTRAMIQNNTFLNNSGEDVIRLLTDTSVRAELKGNIFENNTCSRVLAVEWGQYYTYDQTGVILVAENVFRNNIPRSYHQQLPHIIPVVTAMSDRPVLSFVSNTFDNPLFPYELEIIGDFHDISINAIRNYWGSKDESQIQERIYDSSDNYRLCTVHYFPFLLSPDKADVVDANSTRQFLAFNRGNSIGGIVHGTEVIASTGSDYIADRDIIIPHGGKLIIEAGVNILFTRFSSIFVRGELVASGTISNPITFAPLNMITHNSVRLINGSTPWNGRLEVFVNSTWYTVCDTYWTEANARVVCRQLGFYDADYSTRYNSYDGTNEMWIQPFDCEGSEDILQQCDIRVDLNGYCSSHHYDVFIHCLNPQWSGLLFPLDSSVSTMRYVNIIDAGYQYSWSNKEVIRESSVRVHMYHHIFENIRVQYPASNGFEIYYNNPLFEVNLQSIVVEHCDLSENVYDTIGIRLHSYEDFVVDRCHISECHTGIETRDDAYNYRYNILMYVESVSECNVNITIDIDDTIILRSPSLATFPCINTITTVSGGQIGVVVLYTNPYSSVTVTEYGNTTLFVDEREYEYSYANSVLSQGPTVTVTGGNYYYNNDYLIYVKAVNGSSISQPINNPRWFQISNSYLSNVRTGLWLYARDHISVSNVTISRSSVAIGIYNNGQSVYFNELHISDSYRGITIYDFVDYFYLSTSVLKTSSHGIYMYNDDYYIDNWRSLYLIEDTQFYSEGFQSSEAILLRQTIYGSNIMSNWTLIGCTFQNFETVFEYLYFNYYYYYDNFENVEISINLSLCKLFNNEGGVRVYVPTSSRLTLTMTGNTFESQMNSAFHILQASPNMAVMIHDNTFQLNSWTVLRIPNIIRYCSVVNNTFWNNTGMYVIDVYEVYPVNSAISDVFYHVFEGNVFKENKPTFSYNSFDEHQQCVLQTRINSAVIQNNVFDNSEFHFELCLGAYPYFNIDDYVDARFNCWNSTDDKEIADKIFDQNNWNDRPPVLFYPYDTCFGSAVSPTYEMYSEIGGRISEDLFVPAAEGPYLIVSDITVLPNVTLTIEAGTEFRFESNIGILVLGRLLAIGNPFDHITFSAATNSIPLVEGDIRLYGGPSKRHGTLQVYSNGVWGAIIYSHISPNTAVVACRLLGLGDLVGYYHHYETMFGDSSRGRIWNSYIRCSGNEQILADCYIFQLRPCYRCDNEQRNVVVLECHPSKNTLPAYVAPWGGIRFVQDGFLIQNDSKLQFVDISGAGSLHNDAAPSLFISGASHTVIDHLSITNSSSDGIVIDNPKYGCLLQDVQVSDCDSGIVFNNIDHVPVKVERVSSTYNRQYGISVISNEDLGLFNEALFGVFPICAEQINEEITIDTSLDLLFQSRNMTCDFVLRPKRNETLEIEAFHMHQDSIYNCFGNLYIYDNTTEELLGQMDCNGADYIRIISPDIGAAIRVSFIPDDYHDYYYNYDYGYNYDNNYNGYYEFYDIQDGFDDNLGHGFHFHVVTTIPDDVFAHSFIDCDFSYNSMGGMVYTSSNTVSNRHFIHVDRCLFTSNNGSANGNEENYALSLDIQNSDFIIENCLLQDNFGLGGIRVLLEGTDDVDGLIVNCEFERNDQCPGVLTVSQRSISNSYVKIQGNSFVQNIALDSSSVISFHGVYCDIVSNIIFNNDGGRILSLYQNSLPLRIQECSNNVIIFNIGQRINETYTMELNSNGMQIQNNVIRNPANDYEINAISGEQASSGPDTINATYNWWGTASADQIMKKFRDSNQVFGFAEVIFEPYLPRPPISVQNSQCPVGYRKIGNDCYGYKGGAVDLETAAQSCKAEGSSLASFAYDILIDILQARSTNDNIPNSVWINSVLITDNTILPTNLGDKPTQQKCFVLQIPDKELSLDSGLREKSCDSNYPYICKRVGRVYCPNSCFGNGACIGTSCVCDAGWTGDDCSTFNCIKVNNCSGFGECVGPNQCKCRGHWQGRACSTSYCNRFDRCKPCAREDGCGWCDSKQKCIPGTPFAPDKEDCQDWFYYNCFSPGSCSSMIEKIDCNFRQCNFTASDSDKGTCEQCLDVRRCFSNSSETCQIWDEEKCPSGIVFKDYDDTSRINNAEIDDSVVLLDTEDNEELIIYKCPVTGSEDLADHRLFITSEIVDLLEGQIMSSEQAEGILHRIGLVSNLDRHTILMARQADITEAVRYADFDQPVEMEPAGDPAITDDNPDIDLIDELLSGNVFTNGSDVVQLMDAIRPYKCLGHLYVNDDNPEELSISSIIFLPVNEYTQSFTLGDIIIANESSLNVETVREIVFENGTAFVHTELGDCSDDSTYINGIATTLSYSVPDTDEIQLSCPGGEGRQNLLILNDNILEKDLSITLGDTIVGGIGDRFVGKVISNITMDDFVVLEVLTATTVPELEALPHHSQIQSRRRVKRGSFTFSPQFFFYTSYTRKQTDGSSCTGKIGFKYSPSFKFILDIGLWGGLKAAGMEFTGTKEATVEFTCTASEGGSMSFYIPLGQKRFGTFRFTIGLIPIIGSFHGRAGIQLSAGAEVKYTAGFSATEKCTDKATMIYRKGSGLSFTNTKPTCATNASPRLSIGDLGNPDSGLTKASATAVLLVELIAVVPPTGRLPACEKGKSQLPDVLKSNVRGLKKISECSAPGIPTGLSLTASLSVKAHVSGTLCAHNCPDPEKSILLSATAGLDNFALTGTLHLLGYTAKAGLNVPLDFIGYKYAECIAGIIPCCLCTDEITGEEVPGKIDPMLSFLCLCPCYCDPPTNTISSVKKEGEMCQCDLCPDMMTLKRTYKPPECPCKCADQEEREMDTNGICPCQCMCENGSFDTIDVSGECPCECDCPNCAEKGKLGPNGCLCDEECPPCLQDEEQVMVNCRCVCRRPEYECGIPPTCVRGRKGPMCEQPDCFPCQGCNGNGHCATSQGQCSSFCRCSRRWEGECCEQLRPRRFWGDPHLETLDGTAYDYFGIGEFVFCHSRENDFGVHTRFFKYNNASLVGGLAIKSGDSVVTITTPGSSAQDKPNLRIDGDLYDVVNGDKLRLGNSSVLLDIQSLISTGSSEGPVAYMSYQFGFGTSFTVEVRYSPVMARQYLNVIFAPTIDFNQKTEGLCGFMDDDVTQDFYGPDGMLYTDPIEFAESWRLNITRPPEEISLAGTYSSWSWTQSNFHEDDTVDITYTDPNFVPVYETEAISDTELKAATDVCVSPEIEKDLLDECIFDLVVTKDPTFAEQETLKTGCPSQCSGKGTCVDRKCQCLDGWSGEDCTIGDCGMCVRGSCSKGFCDCEVGWEGQICDEKATCFNVNNCTNSDQGQCKTTDTCLCTPGFTGTDCSLVAECVGDCSGNGICIDFDVCACYRGWNGTSCETPSCELLGYCTGNGVCSAFDTCECYDGWGGLSCSIPDCSALGDCYGNGDCTDPDLCQCYSGYVGQACNTTLDCVHLNNCSDQGICFLNEQDELQCRCNYGYTGDDCSSIDCSEVNGCSNQGTCIEPNLCDCLQLFTGSTCAQYSCSNLDRCSGHGDCIDIDHCVCHDGWSGDKCEIPSCEDVNNCTEQGICVGLNNCECFDDYDGRNCSEKISENFDTPTFEKSLYISTVVENVQIGTSILKIQANDSDSGRNGEVSYSIAGGSEAFIIDTITGDISTRKSFDFESEIQPKEYELVGITEDRGTPVKSSAIEVVIIIADANDNCPVVNGIESNIEVTPDTSAGSVITQISATDEDSGLNSQLVYDFFQASDTILNLFEINSENGNIAVKDVLSAGEYTIAVLISDQGDIPCSTQTRVTVKVMESLQVDPSTTTSITTSSITATAGQDLTTFQSTTAALSTSTGNTDKATPPTTAYVNPSTSTSTSGIPQTTSQITTETVKLDTTSTETTSPAMTTLGTNTTPVVTEANVYTTRTSPSACTLNSDCNNGGLCISGGCQCTCLFTGTRCETEAAVYCYEVDMVIETIYGQPAEFSPQLGDTTSTAFMATVQTLLPIIERLIFATETTVNQYLAAYITGFAEGSLVVRFTVSLTEAITGNRLKQELEDVLTRQVITDITVKDDIVNVILVNEPTTTLLPPPSTTKIPFIASTGTPYACPSIRCDSEYGPLTFPSVSGGMKADSYEKCLCDIRAYGTLRCPSDLSWSCSKVIVNRCEIGNTDQQLQEIYRECNLNEDILLDVLRRIEDLSRAADLGVEGVHRIVGILQKAADTQSTKTEVMQIIIRIISNLMDANKDDLKTAQMQLGSLSRATKTLEIMLKLVMTSSRGVFSYAAQNLGVDVRAVTRDEFENGLQFNSISDEEIHVNVHDNPHSRPMSSLRLPSSLADRLYVQGVDTQRVLFVVYRTSTLFVSSKLLDDNRRSEVYQNVPNTQVISASIKDQVFSDLQEPVQLRFRLKHSGDRIKRSQCVYWNYEADNGHGKWSSDGCQLVTESHDEVTCECDHLTNFAVLTNIQVDITPTPRLPTAPADAETLDLRFLIYIGCSVVLVTICGIYLTYLPNRNLLTKKSSKILLNFCTAVLGLCVTMIILTVTDERPGNDPSIGSIWCTVVAALVHFFTLVSAFWTTVLCVNDFVMSRIGSDPGKSMFTIKAAVFAWGVPIIIVLATSSIAQLGYSRADICFPSRIIFMTVMVAPLAGALVLNLVLYLLIGVRLYGNSASLRSAEDHKEDVSDRVKEGLAVIVALAVTYVAGFFALDASVGYIAQPMFAFCCIIMSFIVLYVHVWVVARRFLYSCVSFRLGSQSSSDSSVASSLGKEYFIGRTSQSHPASVPMTQVESSRLVKLGSVQHGESNDVIEDDDTNM